MSSSVLVLLALALNGATALGSRIKRAVTIDGAVAGFLVGTIIMIGGGIPAWVMLMWFFGSSTVIGKLTSSGKRRAVELHEKGSERDWVQVLANSGLAAAASALYGITGSPAALLAAAVALAAATADTWASEIGPLSSRPPRSIITGRRLPTGTSGGVTALGTAASLAGGVSVALIYLVTLLLRPESGHPAAALIVAAGGLLGSVVDSLLGAAVQAQYVDERGNRTERKEGNTLLRGLPAINNDAVNALSGALVSALALFLV